VKYRYKWKRIEKIKRKSEYFGGQRRKYFVNKRQFLRGLSFVRFQSIFRWSFFKEATDEKNENEEEAGSC
jgi:hypothetical protein